MRFASPTSLERKSAAFVQSVHLSLCVLKDNYKVVALHFSNRAVKADHDYCILWRCYEIQKKNSISNYIEQTIAVTNNKEKYWYIRKIQSS